MGKFNYLLGKGKSVYIPDENGKDVEYVIKPLTNRHMDVFTNSKDESESEMINKLVLASLQQTDESLTLDDVKDLPFGLSKNIIEVVMEVNELQ
jgi:hypothetical protein